VTTPDDVQQFMGSALPFCSASCNTNSLVAIGDEEGGIRLMDTSPESNFKDVHVKFQVHPNAIMDIAFSSDDFLLASASGDQTTRLVDMHTQQVVCILSGHTSSVKRVRFNPREDRLITTSSRDGTVQVWDLRCSGNSSVQSLRASFEHQVDADGYTAPATRYSTAKLDVAVGHRFTTRQQIVDTSRKEPSITTFEHMPHGREHLIITASDANASLKVWDIRNSGRRNPVPLSSTPIPSHHRRDYGISSMVLSGDGARLYAVCRDATIYAYSANHLALGHVTEMSSKPGRQRMLKDPKEGLGPLYGFKHPSFRVGTFYIRAALRPAKDDQSEILAVGSTDNTPILFPTDERHFPLKERVHEDDPSSDDDEEDLPLPRMAAPLRPSSALPIHQHGTALVRAHTKEVTSLVWSHNGDLVSVSDDFTARCWRRDANRARELRLCGEGEGARWNSGWADVEASWDEDEVDEVGNPAGGGGIVCEWSEADRRQATPPPLISKARLGSSRMAGSRRIPGGPPMRATRLSRF
jgi:WD40 repeat protein